VIRKVEKLYRRVGIEPYWYLIVPLLLAGAILFAINLINGFTPGRVFIRIAPLKFDVYWYGVCIVGGIGLGSYVVSRLVLERGTLLFTEQVPRSLQRKPLASLKLPGEIERILAKRGIRTVGKLLLAWGFDPHSLGLNREGLQKTHKHLTEVPEIQAIWLTDAPWRPWNPDHVWNGVLWCLILGVIGARLYHVLTPSPSMAAFGIESPIDYFRNPSQLINLRNGGLGIYGGMAGGALGLFWYTRRQKLSMIAWADLAVVGMALGQVFGRWGNYFNQELYGRPSNLPWAIAIEPAYRLPEYSEYARFHPAFLYESLWSLLTFVVLLILARRYSHKLLTGDLMALYLIFYAIGRTLLETVRLDSRLVTLGGVNLNMAIATLVSLLVAVCMLGWRIFARWRLQGD
jgi:phosphatidylglycerol:prolipoprotein diacylglycerol transferase